MTDAIYCDGWELYQYSENEVPPGFEPPCYRLTTPGGETQRNVSADKLANALDELFEISA